MILNYIIDFFLGGITGYLTNNYAIKMLFKKYWKMGGVIEDRYEDFIKNMSDLVEKDLITHKTLINELDSDKFREILRKIITDTIKIELPKTSGAISLDSLPNIDKSFENINAYFQDNSDSLLLALMDIIKNKSLADIISEEEFNYILNHPAKEVFNNLNSYESDINKLVYTFLSSQSINSLVSERTLHSLTDNTISRINKVDFSNYDDLVNKSYQELWEIMDLDKVILNLETKLKKMKVADFINNPDNLSKELFKRVVAIINSKDGNKLLVALIDNILDELENISMTLSQLLDDDFLNSLEGFIIDKLPDLLAKVIDLITSSKSEIESLVNQAIDEEFQKGIFTKILKSLIDIFIKNLAGKFSIVDKIKASIEEYGEGAPRILTNQLVTYLRTNTLGNIVKTLRDEKIITSPILTKLLQRNLQDLSIDNISFIDDFLAKELGEVFSFDLSIIKREILANLLEKYKSEYLYNGKLKDSITKKILEFIEDIKDTKLANFLSDSDINIKLDAGKLKNILRKEYPLLNHILVSDLNLKPKLEVDLSKLWQEIKQFKLNLLYSKINNEKSFTNIEKATYALIHNNLKDVLKNNISAIARNELSKSNPQEISAMVEEFMGKELRPINTIGAVLGAIMSVGYAGATVALPYPYITLGMSTLVYGFAGALTNQIAIWMLFKPYKPWIKILPFVSPFVGVVPAQKPKFAINLSSFVKTKLLSDDSIKELYYKERASALESLSNLIADNNFAIIDVLLREGDFLERLTSFSFQELQELTRLNSDKLTILITNKIKSILEESLDDSLPHINKWIVDKIYTSDYTDKIHNYIEDKISNRKIGQQSKVIVKLLSNKIDILFETIADELDYDKLIKLANNYKKEYKNYVSEKSLKDLAGKAFVNNISQKLSDLLQDHIDKDTLVKPIVDYLNKQEFNPNNRLKELFNGVFPDLLTKNISYLLEIISQEIEGNKEEIKTNIKEDLPFGAFSSKVSPIVDDIINNKLPLFLKSKEQDILSILLPVLDYKLSDIGFNEQILNLNSLELNIKETLNNNEIKRSISKIAKDLITDIADIPLDELLKIINIKNLRDLLAILSPLIKYLVDQTKDSIEYSSEKIATLSKSIIEEIITDISANTYYHELLKDINLSKEISKLLTLIKSDERIKISLNELIKDILFRLTQNEDLYDEEIMNNDLEEFINKLLEKDSAVLEERISPFIKDIFLNANSLIDIETKKELLHYLLESVFDSLGDNLNEAIASIDIEKVVKDEINKMEPKEIKDLFYSFAEDYFKKLVRYGFLGVIPGLIAVVIKVLYRFISF